MTHREKTSLQLKNAVNNVVNSISSIDETLVTEKIKNLFLKSLQTATNERLGISIRLDAAKRCSVYFWTNNKIVEELNKYYDNFFEVNGITAKFCKNVLNNLTNDEKDELYNNKGLKFSAVARIIIKACKQVAAMSDKLTNAQSYIERYEAKKDLRENQLTKYNEYKELLESIKAA